MKLGRDEARLTFHDRGIAAPTDMVLTAAEMLRSNPDPSEAEIRRGLNGSFCRCTGYDGIINAIRHAAEGMAASKGVSITPDA